MLALYVIPCSLQTGSSNPTGVHIQDPAAAVQWPPPVMNVPPPPGPLPFPILLPQGQCLLCCGINVMNTGNWF